MLLFTALLPRGRTSRITGRLDGGTLDGQDTLTGVGDVKVGQHDDRAVWVWVEVEVWM